MKDFPKLHTPFKREMISEDYLVTPQVDPDYEWVFKDEGVRAVDKLDGTNIGLRIEDGKVTRVFNRKNEKFVFPPSTTQTKWEGACMEGIAFAIQKGWLSGLKDGDYYGELIGEIINGNPHKIKGHMFVPFHYLARKCHWRSWIKNQYPKDFDTISTWFKNLDSLFNQVLGLDNIKTEGLVFHHPDGKRMAKLRRDMFDWYEGERH